MEMKLYLTHAVFSVARGVRALLRGGEELIKFQDIEHTVELEAVGLFLLCVLNSITAFCVCFCCF